MIYISFKSIWLKVILLWSVYLAFSIINSTLYNQILINLNSWLNNFLILFIIFSIFSKITLIYKFVVIFLVIIYEVNITILKDILVIKELVLPLWVGTLNIHPILFYLSFIGIFLKFKEKCLFFFNQAFGVIYNDIVITSLTSLMLGGLWGLQSLSWGYLWVNDHIEWILLLLLLYLVQFIHLKSIKIFSLYPLLPLYSLFILLLLVRLNLVATRHSFFTQQHIIFSLIGLLFFFLFFVCFIRNSIRKIVWKFFSVSCLLLLLPILMLNVFVLVIILKYSSLVLLYFFFSRIGVFFYNIKSFFLHSIIIISVTFWSFIFSLFFLNFSLLKITLPYLYIYNKVIQYSSISYINSQYIHDILEFITFNFYTSIFYLNQLESLVFFTLFFNLLCIFALFFANLIILLF